jgi:hypothetical protein
MGTTEYWVRFNPHGCAVSSCTVDFAGPLESDAHRMFTPKVADRRREAAEGWWMGKVDQDGLDELVPCLRGRCKHRAAR